MQDQPLKTDIDEKFNFFIDLLCDDFCMIDENGNYVIKPEMRKQFEDESRQLMQQNPVVDEPPK